MAKESQEFGSQGVSGNPNATGPTMSAPYYATAGRSQPESNDATDDGSAEGMDAYCKDEYLIGQQFDPNSFKGRF